jgi:hypothetical protein
MIWTNMSTVFGTLGGRAMRRETLRSLVPAAFFTELGVSIAFPLCLL